MKRERAAQRAEIVVAFLLLVSVAGSATFVAAFFGGESVQLEGAGAGLSLVSLAFALALWSRALMPKEQAVDRHESPASPRKEDDEVARQIERGALEVVGRRRWLVRLGWLSLAALGVAALAPLRSLGLAPPGSVFPSGWKRGLHLTREDGKPVRAADLEVGSIVTVFPEGEVGPDHIAQMSTDAVVLIRVPTDALRPGERAGWAPQGLIAYSKICTHAGCPVGLYRAESRQLLCPCHQSTFDVTDGGRVLFGPAARPLPQLPLEIATDGTLRSAGGLSGPIGPDRWNAT